MIASFRTLSLLTLAVSALGLSTVASAAGLKIAYLQTDGSSNGAADTLSDLLSGDSRFDLANSTLFSGPVSNATLLSNYDVVLASANSSPSFDGDKLADYVDAGGKLVFTTFIGQYENIGTFFPGRFNDPGYNPFTGPVFDAYAPVTMTSYDASHPIMNGVTSLASAYYAGDYTGVSAGSTLVASWSNGNPLVAVNAGKNIVGITLFPDVSSYGHATGNYRQLFANSLAYAAQPVPEPASMAALGLGATALLRKRRRKA